jgi:uncharacterized repeat protein (TIGR03806 family)
MGLVGSLSASACGSAGDAQVLYEPWMDGPGPRQPAFLAFSDAYDGRGPAPVGAPGFPKLLSQTGAFSDAASLEPMSGIVPYDIQAPLWSDGANKQRWIAVPEGTSIGYSEAGPYGIPTGTVFVKHFELALDERAPDQRRRLETRFWVAAGPDAQYGVSYKWNDDQADAELLITSETEMLSVVAPDGSTRAQPYFFPGPADCQTCHDDSAGFVLGVRTAQLNRELEYRRDRPAVNQLAAWSSWGLLDRHVDAATTAGAPRLAALDDEDRSLEDRVRSYWDGNCAMCHAGTEGSVPGWDARYTTALDEQGLMQPPKNGAALASQLIAPGSPDDSFIYVRSDTTETALRMPPLGRNRVDEVYVELLASWISSLGAPPAQ